MPKGVYPRTKKHGAAISAGLIGKKHIMTQKEYPKISAALIGRKSWNKDLTKETDSRVAKMAAASGVARKGKSFSFKHNAAISAAHKKRFEDPAERKKMSAAHIGKKYVMRYKEYPEMSAAQIKRYEDPTEREKQSIALKKLWQDREFVSKQMVARRVFPNKAEKFLGKLFQELFPDKFKYTGDGKDKQYVVAGEVPDFVNINGRKQIIELFGEPFHEPEEEQQRIDLFAQHGYRTLVIWYRELQDMNILVKRVTEFVKG